ncbi:Uu.00g080610.m01.CDS01 [Anthostomella pinea]|uniref:Uu.00g080610.m01.CDS01 n=1 Tax=Anthostomella pinea TaxID=933095 RepID=A0AAI8VL11_9PEZI|nr:Uu.00g080610.m01.CDS01 [Anthostomella pinea]
MGKPGNLKRSRGQPANTAEDTDVAVTQKDPEPVVGRPKKKARVEESRSLFIRSLPPSATTETLTEFFSQHFPVKHATVVVDPQTKASRGYGFVTFTDAEDTKAAQEQLKGHKIGGRPVVLEIAEPRHRQTAASADAAAKKEERLATLAEARKAPKLIVRNLPWSIKHSDQLAGLFQSHGKIKFADLPQAKGKLSGFGFVTMRGRKNAQAAIDAINGKTVDGRTLAVDWAVDKQTWDKKQQPAEDASPAKPKESETPDVGEASEDANEDEPPRDDDEDDDLDTDVKNFMKNHMQNLEDEDSDAENEDESEGDDASDTASAPKKPLMTSNNTTLFIRNLPFTTTEEALKSHFEQFGHVRYARIVVDRATDRPAGTGFVCFASDSDSKACLKGAPRPQQTAVTKKKSILQDEMADASGKYTIDGRILQVTQAVSKDEANHLTETGAASRQIKDKDKRRLYLLAEGVINVDSPMHRMLAPSEVKLRDDSHAQRKKLIQGNPSLHLSLTRLAVRNLPRNIDSKKLKALAREAVVGFASDVKEGRRQPLSKEENNRGGEEDKEAEHRRKEKGKGIVKQTKIVFENKEGSKVSEADGASKSRGYGFVEYSSHRWALMGLRWLNGHALKNDAGKTHRLIVEFAIENAQVVARRKEFMAKSRAGNFANAGNPNETELNPKRKQFGNAPKNKDFSVSKGKRQAPNGKGKGDKPEKEEAKDPSAKNAFQDRVIGRKRMVRKKKAMARG